MRETQKKQAEKEKSQPKPVKALWHLKQFDNVESKVKQRLKEVSISNKILLQKRYQFIIQESQRSASRPGSVQSNYLRAHQRTTGPQLVRSQSAADLRRASVGSAVDLVRLKYCFVQGYRFEIDKRHFYL